MDQDEVSKYLQMYNNGDVNAAISAVYRATVGAIYKYVYSRTGKKEWTEDIVSETYMTLIEIFDKYNHQSKIETFIIGIARNKMLKYFNSLNLSDVEYDDEFIVDDQEEDNDGGINGAKEAANLLRKEQLTQILVQLKDNERLVIEKRFFEGLNIKETAKETNLSEANVRVIQHRAIDKAAQIAAELQ